jgi:ABC-type phosphate transport system substrate-binding protein
MKRHAIAISGVALLAILAGDVSDAKKPRLEPLVAVVHGSRDETRLGTRQLKNIYLGRQTRWSDGTPIEPYMRPVRSDAGFAFMRTILQMTPAKFRYHWQGRQLSGRGTAPSTASTVKRLAAVVTRFKGGVGYVTESEARALKPYVDANRVKLIPIN